MKKCNFCPEVQAVYKFVSQSDQNSVYFLQKSAVICIFWDTAQGSLQGFFFGFNSDSSQTEIRQTSESLTNLILHMFGEKNECDIKCKEIS